jgi:[ribosomal protein S5]-alanine N-acetyltransferase
MASTQLHCVDSIVLRTPSLSDAGAIAKHANDRNVWINLRDAMPHPYTLDDARQWLGSTIDQDPVSLFAIDLDGEAIGTISLVLGTDIERRSAELGYWVGSAYWGRGIATAAVLRICKYAFDDLHLLRVFATPMTGNAPSKRVLEKAGFTLEGIMRSCYVKDDTIVNAALYARIAPPSS